MVKRASADDPWCEHGAMNNDRQTQCLLSSESARALVSLRTGTTGKNQVRWRHIAAQLAVHLIGVT